MLIIMSIIKDQRNLEWKTEARDFCYTGVVTLRKHLKIFLFYTYFFRFISQHAEKLFQDNSGSSSGYGNVRLDNDQVEELAALLPPYEVFTNVHEDDRCRHFFDVSRKHGKNVF